MMEILSVGDDRTKKGLLLKELEQYGVIFEGDEALKAPEPTLDRLLQEVKSKQDTSTRSQDLFMDLYESMICDYITKLRVASVFFSRAIFGLPYSGRLITITITSKDAHIGAKT